jgi:diguanylate cyclase (GGDEF)-like protein
VSVGTPLEVVLPASPDPNIEFTVDAEDHPQMGSIEEVLASVHVFASLQPEQLARLVASATEHTFPSGHILVRQGDEAGVAYVIVTGRVRVTETVSDSPVQMLLGEMGPGEITGEIGVIRQRLRSASVITLERTRCIAIPADVFLELLHNSTDMSLALLRTMAGRLYEADRLLARHAPDPLTGLPGRRAFHELYRRLTASARRRGASILVLVLDVLHLKDVNDRFGYTVGDDVLRTVGDALIEASRSSDLVSRYGGDEFAALLIDAGAADAEVIIKRVQQKLRALTISRDLPLRIECRIGYTVSMNPPEAADELLRFADEQMQANRFGQAR